MKKILFAVFLVLFTVSCASFTEWAGSPEGNDALAQTAVILALANETPAIRNDYLLSAYYYPPLMLDHYVPPDIWKAWTPLQRSLWIESARESDLRDYEYKIKSINNRNLWDLEDEAQRLIDDIKRANERAKDELESKKEDAEDAADELKRAADDAKLELGNAAWWAKFGLKSAADDADFERLVAENATTETRVLSDKGIEKKAETIDFSFLANSLPGKEPTPLPGFILDGPAHVPPPPPGFVLDTKETAAEKVLGKEGEDKFDITPGLPIFSEKKETPLGGEIGQIIGREPLEIEKRAKIIEKSEDQVEVTRWFGSSDEKQFVLVGVDYAKRARPFVFLLETAASGEAVLYGRRWPPKDPINWREEKEVSRIVKNGLANAIKEIIDELGER